MCAQSATALTALQQLVSSVSHNALASALPGQPPSSQQQFSGELIVMCSISPPQLSKLEPHCVCHWPAFAAILNAAEIP